MQTSADSLILRNENETGIYRPHTEMRFSFLSNVLDDTTVEKELRCVKRDNGGVFKVSKRCGGMQVRYSVSPSNYITL